MSGHINLTDIWIMSKKFDRESEGKVWLVISNLEEEWAVSVFGGIP